MLRKRWWWILPIVAVLAGAWLTRNVCVHTWIAQGVRLNECADGDLVPVARLEAGGLTRGQLVAVRVGAEVRYTRGSADEVRSAPVSRFDPSLAIVDREGHETPITPEKGWKSQGSKGWSTAFVRIPQLPDGDYRLRARISGTVGSASVDAPLPLYAPAKVHVVTDRPLYEPGNTMKFRAVVLRARDLAPLDGRPGTWTVVDPSGDTVLEERVPAGEWGVTSGSLPLDAGAAAGSWHVRYTSGDATDDVVVSVHPFTLPRFRLEASSGKPFYRAGEKPELKGSVVYASGAPVPKAEIELSWESSGDWPPPTEWLEKLLPKHVTGDASGRFTISLPTVPGDLRGRATLSASLAAIDPAGDRVEGSASVLLSEDAIQVSTVTELPDGLVGGFNNRVFFRLSDAAGTVLPGTQIVVRRAWDPSDKGIEATCDEDGVAALQLDPGPAVNVVIPPMPVRLPPKEEAVSRSGNEELLNGSEPSLADQRAMDGWVKLLDPCARFSEGGDVVTVGLRVDRSGAIVAAAGPGGDVAECAVQALRTAKLPAGAERLYQVSFDFNAPQLASLSPMPASVPEAPGGVEEAFNRAARDARICLPEDVAAGGLARQFTWRVKRGTKEIQGAWAAAQDGVSIPATAQSCIEQKFARLALSEAAESDALGTVHFEVSPSPRVEAERPEATTMLGYELEVLAKSSGRELGRTKVRLGEGHVPAVRLRATPVLAKAGGTVTAEILRGPEFRGELPKKLLLASARGGGLEGEVDREKRTVSWKLPADADGWYSASFVGAEARVFVRAESELSVAVSPDKPRYAPGETAKLSVRTTAAGAGHPAAVGLFGVDSTLGQLAHLTGPDDFARVRPRVPMLMPAFDGLDAQALTMGRVRGANAAAAIVMRVGMPEAPPSADSAAAASVTGVFDPSAQLVDRFYGVLAELHVLVREWEEKAPAGEQMHPPKMATLWKEALAQAEQKGVSVTDAYGRRLRLSQLPADLLALTDPRAVVVSGTRLPEDVENWTEYVAKERP